MSIDKIHINLQDLGNEIVQYITRIDEIGERQNIKIFWKLYLYDFLKVLDGFESKELQIFTYICRNVTSRKNLFESTYKNMQTQLVVSQPTIAKTMKNLKEKRFIRKVKNGLWMVNPDIFMQGSEFKREYLLQAYTSKDPLPILDKIVEKNDLKLFWKLYLYDFLAVLDGFQNKELEVFAYICRNLSSAKNLFGDTYKGMKAHCKVSQPTIAKTMKNLKEKNFIRKVNNGLWMVNPDIFMQGNDFKRKRLFEAYKNKDPLSILNKTAEKL